MAHSAIQCINRAQIVREAMVRERVQRLVSIVGSWPIDRKTAKDAFDAASLLQIATAFDDFHRGWTWDTSCLGV